MTTQRVLMKYRIPCIIKMIIITTFLFVDIYFVLTFQSIKKGGKVGMLASPYSLINHVRYIGLLYTLLTFIRVAVSCANFLPYSAVDCANGTNSFFVFLEFL